MQLIRQVAALGLNNLTRVWILVNLDYASPSGAFGLSDSRSAAAGRVWVEDRDDVAQRASQAC